MIKTSVKYCVVLSAAVLVLFNAEASLEYAKNGLALCEEVLVPSLFPFFVCSGLLVYSGACEWLAVGFAPIMRPLFNIGGVGASAFVLGIISGYPLGAKVAVGLYEDGYIEKNEAERLLSFCNNSGPLFLLGSVGVAIYHSIRLGAILYISHIAAALTVGGLFRFYKRGASAKTGYTKKEKSTDMAVVFSRALSDSVTGILNVCGAVIFFGVIANILTDFLPAGLARSLFMLASELTNGIKSISSAEISLAHKLVLSSVAAGFAGICIHLQVMSVAAGKGLSLLPYISGKLLHGIISGAYTALLLKIYPITAEVFASAGDINGAFFTASLYTCVSASVIFIIAGAGLLTEYFIKRHKKFLSHRRGIKG